MLVTHLLGALVGGVMYAFFLGIYQLVRTPPSAGYGFGASALAAAVIYLLPSTVASVLVAPVGSRLVARFGGRLTVGIAGLLAAGGFGALATVPSSSTLVVPDVEPASASIPAGRA